MSVATRNGKSPGHGQGGSHGKSDSNGKSDSKGRLLPDKIGAYGISQEIGRGGMGIVYLGRDARLDRPVAIKVLSDSFAHDPERLARFEREARLLASLSHPNIATIHGLEDDDGRQFLTLEYVEGETLAERIGRGPLAWRESVELCSQIADALEAAHENGVIHRDLKPSNVKIKSSGEVKVLDFGLAKGFLTESDGDPNDSPTMSYAPTGTGVILGTAAYMSPEQARGKTVDRRTDVWSFGCVLFECLTGRQAFAGETTSDTIARILVQDPEWNLLPGATPQPVRDLLHRCLEKDPKRRLRDIGDVRLTLQDALVQDTSGVSAGIRAATSPRGARSLGWVVAAVCLAAAVAGAVVWKMAGPGSRDAVRPVARYDLTVPSDIRFRGASITPDGSRFVFTGKPKKLPGGDEPLARAYVRTVGSYEIEAIPGTEGISWAPNLCLDGRSILYIAPSNAEATKRKIYRAPLDGSSPPIALADWNDAWGGMVELANGDLLILTDMGKSFVRLPANGSAAGPKTKIDAGAYTGRLETMGMPGALGSHGVLLDGISYGPRGWLISVVLLDPETGKARILIEEGGCASYAPTGHLLFTRGDVLHAVRFDRDRLRIQGEPVAVMSGVRTLGSFIPGAFGLSRDGTLLYAPGGRVGEQRRLVLLRNGVATPLTEDRRAYSNTGIVALSRVGDRVAVAATNASGLDEIWIHEPGRSSMRRLVSLPADCNWPVWSPDGRHLAFLRMASNADDGIYVQDVNGGAPWRILKSESSAVDYYPWSWSPDGATLLMTRSKDGNSDVWMLPLSADARSAGKPRALVASRAQELQPAWSPDGRMIAFTSDESGKPQVVVAPYRGEGAIGPAVPVTPGRAYYPRWVTSSRLVYYDENLEQGMAVNLSTSGALSASDPSPILDHHDLRVSGFAARSDGSLVAIQRSPEEDDVTRYHVVLNWLDELKRKTRRS